MRDKCYLCGDVLEKTSITNVCTSCFIKTRKTSFKPKIVCLLCSGVLEDNSNTNVCDSCFINKWADGYDFGLDEEAEK